MTLLIVVLWLVTVPLVLVALTGPRRWFRGVTDLVRPGTSEPSANGYAVLTLRNWLLALVALAITVPVTVDTLRVNEEELLEVTERGVGLVPDDDLTGRRIEAEVEVLLERDVFVDDVTSDVPDADGDSSDGDGTENYYEVALTSRSDRVGTSSAAAAADRDDEGDPNAPTVCVKVVHHPGVEPVPDVKLLESIAAGRCDDEV